MPEYIRARVEGGTYFLTLVTFERQPLFDRDETIHTLRDALRTVQAERPFTVDAAVVLPDHMHFLWTLPAGDADYSRRVGRMKVLVTRAIRAPDAHNAAKSGSRQKQREADVWQRRFWEHAIRDEADFQRHLDYIHFNPVKHGYAQCPHAWQASSFATWVKRQWYEPDWACACRGDRRVTPQFDDIAARAGE